MKRKKKTRQTQRTVNSEHIAREKEAMGVQFRVNESDRFVKESESTAERTEIPQNTLVKSIGKARETTR